jgi:hypothetical protein
MATETLAAGPVPGDPVSVAARKSVMFSIAAGKPQKTTLHENVLFESSRARHLPEKRLAHPRHMRPLARYATVGQIRRVRKDRRLPPSIRAGAAALRFRDGWRTRVMRAMRRAFGARTQVTP